MGGISFEATERSVCLNGLKGLMLFAIRIRKAVKCHAVLLSGYRGVQGSGFAGSPAWELHTWAAGYSSGQRLMLKCCITLLEILDRLLNEVAQVCVLTAFVFALLEYSCKH